MPACSTSSHQLMKVAEQYGIEIPDHVLAAVRSAAKASELERWVEHLNNSLLAMQDSNTAAAPQSHRPGFGDANADGLPTLTRDLGMQHAIDTLDASSQQLALRTRTLTTQNTLLAPRSTISDRLKRGGSDAKGYRTISQSQDIRLLNEAKANELISNFNTRQGLINKDAESLSIAIGERLRADDRLFELLEQYTQGLPIHSDLSELSTRAQQLSEILHAKRACALKDRLDRIYLNALAKGPSNDIDPAEAAEAIPELKRDIQSLYTEINDVVAMSVGQGHVNKVQRVLAGVKYEQKQKREQSLQHALSRIARMTAGLCHLSLQADRLQGQQQALNEMSRYAISFASAGSTPAASTTRNCTDIETVPHDDVDEKISQAEVVRLTPFDYDSLSEAARSTAHSMEEARQTRGRALALLQNVDSPTDVGSLDALDQRIAAANRAFDEMVKPPKAR